MAAGDIAIAVAGSRLQFSSTGASAGSYTTIKGVSGFTGPSGTKASIDVTAIDDTAKQKIADLPDYGNLEFTLFWRYADATHQALKTGFDNVGTTSYFRILTGPGTPNAGGTGTVQGEVSGMAWDFSKGNAVTVRVTVTLSGALTWT